VRESTRAHSSQLPLVAGGIVVTLVPLLTAILIGRQVLKLAAVQWLGGVAGTQTMQLPSVKSQRVGLLLSSIHIGQRSGTS
jgi:uncharacterized transporter YbjL